MKRSNAVGRQICWLVIMAGVAIFSASGFAAGSAAATAITIVDQNGRVVPNTPPSTISQTFAVTVGPNGMLVFSPDPVTISVGDTVRWTWGSSFHSVTSGPPPCTADGQFCSPNDMNCSAGTLSNIGTVYQHTFTQAGTYSYHCAAHCSFGMTGTINVESAPMAQSAFSRKVHGGAGTFDVPLPLTGNVGVECRSGGATNDYQMIIDFATSVTVGGAVLTSGTGSVSSFSVSGSEVTANLTGVTNVQRITVTLMNVNDGTHMGNVPVSMGVLVGDVNGNAAVSAADVALTKSQVGATVSGSNFREDVNANGVINSVDVAQVKSTVGTALPP
ncbi:MAG TPA: plastocyanin/azurin family copper-binding protein [Chthoniobacterales bacterium]|nr:plastocyanin/azurin family copper-binding protein [Chthoniobacterales bacterium]